MTILCAVAIKPFGVAKERLSTVLDSKTRARVGIAVAEHTLHAVRDAAETLAVVTGDDGVAAWASRLGASIIRETSPGLNPAAQSVVAEAGGGPWAIIHADLPLVSPDAIGRVLEQLDRHDSVLAPSADGGTTVVASGSDRFEFSYGVGSFRRHLSSASLLGTVAVSNRAETALDLDTPQDLATALSLRGGAWLRELIPS